MRAQNLIGIRSLCGKRGRHSVCIDLLCVCERKQKCATRHTKKRFRFAFLLNEANFEVKICAYVWKEVARCEGGDFEKRFDSRAYNIVTCIQRETKKRPQTKFLVILFPKPFNYMSNVEVTLRSSSCIRDDVIRDFRFKKNKKRKRKRLVAKKNKVYRIGEKLLFNLINQHSVSAARSAFMCRNSSRSPNILYPISICDVCVLENSVLFQQTNKIPSSTQRQ